MKRIATLITAMLAALALFAGPIAPPADALPANTPTRVTFGTIQGANCRGWAWFGQYAGYAVAQFDEDTTSNCHLSTSIEVVAVITSGQWAGYSVSFECENWGRLSNQHPGTCFYDGNVTTVLMPGGGVPGTNYHVAYGFNWRGCLGPNVLPSSCGTSNQSIYT